MYITSLLVKIVLLAIGVNTVNAVYYCSNYGVSAFHLCGKPTSVYPSKQNFCFFLPFPLFPEEIQGAKLLKGSEGFLRQEMQGWEPVY